MELGVVMSPTRKHRYLQPQCKLRILTYFPPGESDQKGTVSTTDKIRGSIVGRLAAYLSDGRPRPGECTWQLTKIASPLKPIKLS